MEYELSNAIAELREAYEFFEEIAEFPLKEMAERVEKKDPSFIEHVETMECLRRHQDISGSRLGSFISLMICFGN